MDIFIISYISIFAQCINLLYRQTILPNIEIEKTNRAKLTDIVDETLDFLVRKETTQDYYDELIEKNKNIEAIFIDVFGTKESDEHKTAEMNNNFYKQF